MNVEIIHKKVASVQKKYLYLQMLLYQMLVY